MITNNIILMELINNILKSQTGFVGSFDRTVESVTEQRNCLSVCLFVCLFIYLFIYLLVLENLYSPTHLLSYTKKTIDGLGNTTVFWSVSEVYSWLICAKGSSFLMTFSFNLLHIEREKKYQPLLGLCIHQ